MRTFGRRDGWLILGLVFAAAVIFARPVSSILDIARDVERAYGLALVPGLLVLTVVYLFYLQDKRQAAKAEAMAASAAALLARQRAQELERLIGLGNALARALDLQAIRDALLLHLPALTGRDDVWALVRGGGHWEPLTGMTKETRRETDALRASQADHVLALDSDRRSQPDGIDMEGQICFPMVAGGASVGVMGVPAGSDPLTESQRRLLAAAATLLAVSIKNAQLFHEIRENGLRDALTGCFNRAHALEAIDTELRRARRSQMPVSLLMFDLDHFKEINDKFGHLCGDAVLSAVGERMKEVVRGSDLKCRYGGEEFLVLLPETPLEGARRVAETVRREVADLALQWGGETITLTASVGVTAALSGELDTAAVIARADAALYRAKHEGRNCVRVSADAVTV